ncbi:hypothetical protein H4R35_000172 [Dimargaris xerosporica]|nr:hypothetical protein H4R35_000172 [Dimargaris xerosporica]
MRQKISRLILTGDMDTALRLTQQHYPKVFQSNESVYFRLRCQLFVELMRRAGGAQAVSMLEDQGDLDLDAESGDDATHVSLEQSGSGVVGMELESYPNSLANGAKPPTTLTAADFLRRALRCGRRLQRDYTNNSGESMRKALVEIFALLAYPDPAHSPVAYLLDESRRADLVHMLNEEILVSQNKPRIPPLEMAYAQSKVVLDELVKHGSAAANLIQINKDLSL